MKEQPRLIVFHDGDLFKTADGRWWTALRSGRFRLGACIPPRPWVVDLTVFEAEIFDYTIEYPGGFTRSIFGAVSL